MKHTIERKIIVEKAWKIGQIQNDENSNKSFGEASFLQSDNNQLFLITKRIWTTKLNRFFRRIKKKKVKATPRKSSKLSPGAASKDVKYVFIIYGHRHHHHQRYERPKKIKFLHKHHQQKFVTTRERVNRHIDTLTTLTHAAHDMLRRKK